MLEFCHFRWAFAVAVVLLFVSSNVLCLRNEPCGPGYYSDWGIAPCIPCPEGTYSLREFGSYFCWSKPNFRYDSFLKVNLLASDVTWSYLNDERVQQWSTFEQTIVSQAPVFHDLGGGSDTEGSDTYVQTTTRGSDVEYLSNSSPIELNVGTNKGFTAAAAIRIDAVRGNWHSILDLGNGAINQEGILLFVVTNPLRYCLKLYSNENSVIEVCTTDEALSLHEWATLVVTLNLHGSDVSAQIFKNGIELATDIKPEATRVPSESVVDLSVNSSRLLWSNWEETGMDAALSDLVVFDRPFSNSEAVALTQILHRNHASKCAPGYFSDTGLPPCAPCPEGSYASSTYNSTSCYSKANFTEDPNLKVTLLSDNLAGRLSNGDRVQQWSIFEQFTSLASAPNFIDAGGGSTGNDSYVQSVVGGAVMYLSSSSKVDAKVGTKKGFTVAANIRIDAIHGGWHSIIDLTNGSNSQNGILLFVYTNPIKYCLYMPHLVGWATEVCTKDEALILGEWATLVVTLNRYGTFFSAQIFKNGISLPTSYSSYYSEIVGDRTFTLSKVFVSTWNEMGMDFSISNLLFYDRPFYESEVATLTQLLNRQHVHQCGPGQYSLTGLAPCSPCPEGSYASRLHKSTSCYSKLNFFEDPFLKLSLLADELLTTTANKARVRKWKTFEQLISSSRAPMFHELGGGVDGGKDSYIQTVYGTSPEYLSSSSPINLDMGKNRGLTIAIVLRVDAIHGGWHSIVDLSNGKDIQEEVLLYIYPAEDSSIRCCLYMQRPGFSILQVCTTVGALVLGEWTNLVLILDASGLYISVKIFKNGVELATDSAIAETWVLSATIVDLSFSHSRLLWSNWEETPVDASISNLLVYDRAFTAFEDIATLTKLLQRSHGEVQCTPGLFSATGLVPCAACPQGTYASSPYKSTTCYARYNAINDPFLKIKLLSDELLGNITDGGPVQRWSSSFEQTKLPQAPIFHQFGGGQNGGDSFIQTINNETLPAKYLTSSSTLNLDIGSNAGFTAGIVLRVDAIRGGWHSIVDLSDGDSSVKDILFFIYPYPNRYCLYFQELGISYVQICAISETIAIGEWATLVVTLDASGPNIDVKMFKNGIEIATDFSTTGASVSSSFLSDISMSRSRLLWSKWEETPVDASISNFLFYDRAFIASEVSTLTRLLQRGRTLTPSSVPSTPPTKSPTVIPSVSPTTVPSWRPSQIPSVGPTPRPTAQFPSISPSKLPSASPSCTSSTSTVLPLSTSPTKKPSQKPSTVPTRRPSVAPTRSTVAPSKRPTIRPSRSPTRSPI